MKFSQFKNSSLMVLLIASTFFLFGCEQTKTSNANDNSTAPPEPVVVAKTVPVEPPRKTEVKPELKKYGVLTANPESLKANFEVKGGIKGDVYEATYLSKQTGKKEVLITILSRESEVYAVFVHLIPLSKVSFMVQPEPDSPNKAALTSNGVVKLTRDVNVAQCLKGAQKVVGMYERNLKDPPESSLIKFWLNDCGSLPVNLLAPVGEADIESRINDFDI